jgi:hypothetical protein
MTMDQIMDVVAVVNPDEATTDAAIALLRTAHENARRRAERREVSRDAG